MTHHSSPCNLQQTLCSLIHPMAPKTAGLDRPKVKNDVIAYNSSQIYKIIKDGSV